MIVIMIIYLSIFTCFHYYFKILLGLRGWLSNFSCAWDYFMKEVNQLLTIFTEERARRNSLNWCRRSLSCVGIIIIDIIICPKPTHEFQLYTKKSPSSLERQLDARKAQQKKFQNTHLCGSLYRNINIDMALCWRFQ